MSQTNSVSVYIQKRDRNENTERPERRTAIVARELGHLGIDIDIAALSETRLSDEGQLEEIGGGYTFF